MAPVMTACIFYLHGLLLSNINLFCQLNVQYPGKQIRNIRSLSVDNTKVQDENVQSAGRQILF